MPDFQAQNILFGSQFDSTAFVNGVSKSVDSLKTLSAEQKKLQAVLSETSAKLSATQDELFKTQRAYDNLDKGSKTYIESQNKLKTKIDELKNTSTQLNATWAAQKAALESFNTTNAATIASFTKLEVAQKGLAVTASRPIIPVLDPAQITGQLQSVHDLLAKAGGGEIDFTGFEGLHAKLAGAHTDIEQLGVVLTEAKSKLATLAPGTKEFDDLNAVVQTGEKFLGDYNKALAETGRTTDATGEKTVSMRTRIKLLREEMTRLEDAGQENTAQYKKVQLEAARLTDQFADQQQQVKALSSDTKALDFGLAAINAAGAGMQVFLGVVNLLGLSEEDAAEAQRKLLAVMNLVQGAQQLQTLLLKEGAIATLGAAGATRAYAAVNSFLALSFGEAATAATIFKGVLLTTGVGALVIGLGFLIARMVEVNRENNKAAASRELLNSIEGKAVEIYADEKIKVDLLIEKLKTENLTREEKKKIINELKEQSPSFFGTLDAEKSKIEDVVKAYDKYSAALVAAARAKAAFEILSEKIKERLKLETADITEDLGNIEAFVIGAQGVFSSYSKLANEGLNKANANRKQGLADLDADITALTKKYFELDTVSTKLGDPGAKVDKATKTKATKAAPDNVFQAQLLSLKDQLAELSKTSFLNPETIAAKVEADYEKAKQQIISFLNKGQLTELQTDVLINFLGVISKAQLEKDMAEFTKNVTEARRKLQGTLDQLAFEQATLNINNNQDQFERESLLLTLEFQKQTDALINKKDEQEKQIRDDLFLNAEEKKAAIEKIEKDFGDTWLNLEIKNGNDQRDLALKILDQSLSDLENVFQERDLRSSELEQQSIKELTTAYTNGEITFKKYQDELTKIQKDAGEKRKKFAIEEKQQEIDILQKQVDSRTIVDNVGNTQQLNDQQVKDLEEKIRALRKQLLDLNQIPLTNPNPDTSGLDKVFTAYKTLSEGIIGFINDINAAEQQRLERSIALQQTRVENARFIAEKGNAEYLELEQKRLDSLIAKREAAAAKEMAINNALAASNAIVAAISAIAKSGDVITGIAAAVAVLAAIASIYKFVSSLQPPVATFAEGTTYVQQGRYKSGIDTIPARVNIGEAIIPTETNKAYTPAVKAIYTRSVPPSVLNEFVNKYSVEKKQDIKTTHERFISDNTSNKNTNTISTDVINQFVNKHFNEETTKRISENSVYANVLKEFVNRSDSKTVSVNVLNEFVKQYIEKKNTEEFINRYQDIKNITNTDINKEYHPAIKAINENSIPAKVLNEFISHYSHPVTTLNNFIAQYPVTKIPQVDYSRLQTATERSYQKDISTSKIEELLTALHEDVSKFDNTKIVLDENGFAVSLLQAARKQKRLMRS